MLRTNWLFSPIISRRVNVHTGTLRRWSSTTAKEQHKSVSAAQIRSFENALTTLSQSSSSHNTSQGLWLQSTRAVHHILAGTMTDALSTLDRMVEQSSDSHVHWSAAIERLLSECGTDGLPSGDAFKTARSLFQRWTKRSGTLTGLDCVLEGIAIKMLNRCHYFKDLSGAWSLYCDFTHCRPIGTSVVDERMMQIAAQSNAHTLGVMLLQKMAFTKVADSHDMHKLTHFLIKEAPFLAALRLCKDMPTHGIMANSETLEVLLRKSISTSPVGLERELLTNFCSHTVKQSGTAITARLKSLLHYLGDGLQCEGVVDDVEPEDVVRALAVKILAREGQGVQDISLQLLRILSKHPPEQLQEEDALTVFQALMLSNQEEAAVGFAFNWTPPPSGPVGRDSVGMASSDFLLVAINTGCMRVAERLVRAEDYQNARVVASILSCSPTKVKEQLVQNAGNSTLFNSEQGVNEIVAEVAGKGCAEHMENLYATLLRKCCSIPTISMNRIAQTLILAPDNQQSNVGKQIMLSLREEGVLDAFSWCLLLQYTRLYSEDGSFQTCRGLFNEMKHTCTPHPEVFNILMEVAGEECLGDELKSLLDEACSTYPSIPSFFFVFARECCNAYCQNLLREVPAQMTLQGFLLNDQCLNMIQEAGKTESV